MRAVASLLPALVALFVVSCTVPVVQPTGSEGTPSIDLRHQRQELLLCVPTVASMVLEHQGVRRTPRQLKILALGNPDASEEEIHSITRYSDMIRVSRALGRNWHEKTFRNDDAGFDQGLRLIEAEVALGDPVIVDLSLTRDVGHTVVVVAVDRQKAEITMIDPDQPSPGRRVFSLTEFRQIWNELSYGGDFRALIET